MSKLSAQHLFSFNGSVLSAILTVKMNIEVFVRNQGFWLIAETIFECLSDKDLASCRLVCHVLRNFLNNSSFWKKRWVKKLENFITYQKYYSNANFNPNLWLSLYEAFPLWKNICMYYQVEQALPVFQHFVVCLKKQERSYPCSTDPLARMILDDDLEFARLLIGSPANFTAIANPGSEASTGNALHFAARHLMENMIDLLLEYSTDIGIDFSDKDHFGQTALHIIADKETCTSRVRLCLKRLLDHAVTRKISINVKNFRGETPFAVLLKGHTCVKSLDLWMDYPVPFKLKLFQKMYVSDLRYLIIELFKDMKEKHQNIEEAEQMLGYPKVRKTNRLYKTSLAGFRKPQLAAVVVELYRVRKEEHLKVKSANKKHQVEIEGIDAPKKKQKV